MRLRILLAIGLGIVVAGYLVATLPDRSGPVENTPELLLDPGMSMDPLFRSMPPMTDIPTIAASEADGVIQPEESVLGVEIDGEARAYPIDMVRYVNKEILNDTLGGVPIAVTWCDRCQSGIVYGRVVGDRTLTFRVNGTLWQGNMVMEDVETRSVWGQLAGRALSGELEGRSLESYPAVLVPWKVWRARHPDTTVLQFDRTPVSPSEKPAEEILAHQDRFPPDRAGDFLLGLACGDEARGWSLPFLRRHPVLNETVCGRPILLTYDHHSDAVFAFERRVEETVLTFRQDEGRLVDESTGSVWDAGTGRGIEGALAGSTLKPVRATISDAEAWLGSFPGTILDQVDED